MKYKVIALILLGMGLIGWLGPTIINDHQINDYTVKEMKLKYPDGVVDPVSLYIPRGEGPFPGLVFGAGAGADRALYRNWAEGFVKQGFVVLLRSSSYGRKEEVPWLDSRDDVIEALGYLQNLSYVDQNKVLVGGHSASANLAYWVGHKVPDDILGIVAIAGRFPPQEKSNINIPYFLGTGKEDKLVPPQKLKEVAGIISGGNIGKNTSDAYQKIYISEGSNHLQEAWDIVLIREAVKWSAKRTGLEYNNNYNLEKINLILISMRLISAIMFLLGTVMLIENYIKDKINRQLIKILSGFVYFGLFYLTWTSTVSRYLFYFGPFSYKIPKYFITASIVLIISIIFYVHFIKKKKDSFWLDLSYILSNLFIITFIYSLFVYIPSFNYGGSLVAFKMVFVILPIMLLGLFFKKINLILAQRLIFYGLTFIWLLTAVMPVK